MVSTPNERGIKEETNNVYSLPSIPHSIKYFHAAAGYPVKATWLATAVRKHFPESDETQQGHMKRQRQGVRSTKQRTDEEQRTTSTTKKMHDVYIKIHNASETMHTDQTGLSSNIQQRKSIHNGVSRGGRQLHRRRTHEEQDRGINHKSLPGTMGPSHSIGNSQTTNAPPRQ
jgi:hypothetical protein